MKIGIIVITYNIHPEIFLLQMSAIKKLCKDESFSIEVIDNSSDTTMAQDLCYHARLLGVMYRKTFSSSHNSSDSHSFAANLSYQKLKDYYDYMFYIDHDLIPMKSFSIVDILKDKIAAGLGQGAKKKYFWPGCVMFDNNQVDKSLVDFSPNYEFQLDTGGNLYKLIEDCGEDECVFFNETYHQNPHFLHPRYGHYAMINDGMFMHLIGSSNWMELDDNGNRLNSLLNIARERLSHEENIDVHEDKH